MTTCNNSTNYVSLGNSKLYMRCGKKCPEAPPKDNGLLYCFYSRERSFINKAHTHTKLQLPAKLQYTLKCETIT